MKNIKKLYIGISEEHEAGVALVENGQLVFAINEERLTRKKLQDGWPSLSIQQTLNYIRTNYPSHKIDGIGIASEYHISNDKSFSNKGFARSLISLFGKYAPNISIGNRYVLPIFRQALIMSQYSRKRKIRELLQSIPEFKNSKIKYYDHHFCHAVSAIAFSGFENSLAITIDAAGDGYCANAYLYKNKKIQIIHKTPFFHSIGYYYTLVMLILGFKEGQQGKVTGLAARGNPSKTLQIFKKYIFFDKKNKIFQNKAFNYKDNFENLKKDLQMHTREDAAAGIQSHLENCILEFISYLINKCKLEKPYNMVLAGGVFANVLLNSKIAKLNGLEDLFIFPNMTDGGLTAGAAAAIEAETLKSFESNKMNTIYLGQPISDDEILSAINKYNCKYKYLENIEIHVAKLLSEDKVIARYYGKMEFGPRALGNRSILYSAKDPSVNNWLNKKLKRSEFMPFAPVVMDEISEDYFKINQKLPTKYMTIVCEVTEKCMKECPAVVHVDNTARPQVVSKLDNPQLWNILNEYRKITGTGVLVNTSFNMHEEPIVCSPLDAIRAFNDASLDGMAIGNYFVWR